MIPKLLTIENFGPYHDKQVVDFTNFEGELFVVSGPTGAGKTTIFEAILVALYGSNAIKRGSAKELVYTGAKKARIELIFEHQNKQYQIKRQIGTNANVELIFQDGTILNKNISDEVAEIIGMNYKQFKTLAFLPQGEFQKFLLSNDNDKQEILRKIFDTKLIEKFIQKIEEKYKKQKNSLGDIEKELDQYLGEYKNLETLKNDLKIFNKELEVLSEKQRKNQDKLTKQKIINAKFEELKRVKEEIQKLKIRLEKGKQEYQQIEEKYQNLANDEQKVREIEEMLRKIKQDQKLIDEVLSIIDNEKVLNGEKANKQQEKIKLEQEINNFEIFTKEYERKKEVANKNEQELINLQENLTQGEKLKEEIEKLVEIAKKNTYEKASLEKQKSEQEAKNLELYHLQMNNFAYILAQKLEVNVACPVCGSKDHPKPANTLKNDKIVSEKEIDDAQLKLQKLTKKLTNIEIKQAEVSKEKEYRQQELVKLNLANDEKFEELFKQINLLKLQQQEWNILNSSYQKQLSKQINKEEVLIKLQKDLQDIDKNLAVATNSKFERLKELKFNQDVTIFELRNKEQEFSQKLEKYRQEKEELEVKINKIKVKYSEVKEIKAQLEGSLKVHKETVINLEEELQNKKRLDVTELEENQQDLNEKVTDKQVKVKDLKRRSKKVESIQQKQQHELQKYTNLQLLYESAAKNNFEKFVQINYLDQVILKANQRLQLMTSNRYELIRIDKNSLELGVIDYYEGDKSRRKVKSLSGGEQFKASLALALGLADMVSEQMTLMKLDMIFIDEGFGTLDNESLEQVLDVLLELKEQGYMVGLISHVNLLKERIAKQIKVIPKQGQSEIKIISPH